MNMSIFRRSRIVVVSYSNRNCDMGFSPTRSATFFCTKPGYRPSRRPGRANGIYLDIHDKVQYSSIISVEIIMQQSTLIIKRRRTVRRVNQSRYIRYIICAIMRSEVQKTAERSRHRP